MPHLNQSEECKNSLGNDPMSREPNGEGEQDSLAPPVPIPQTIFTFAKRLKMRPEERFFQQSSH